MVKNAISLGGYFNKGLVVEILSQKGKSVFCKYLNTFLWVPLDMLQMI
jgi:hypothetical protein